jgi:hypothetical protein
MSALLQKRLRHGLTVFRYPSFTQRLYALMRRFALDSHEAHASAGLPDLSTNIHTQERLIMKIQSLIAAVLVSVGSAALAQAPVAPKDPLATPRVEQRQDKQETRIDKGIASGALTPKETARLDARENKIQADKLAARADGKVTRAERRKLHREQDRASAAIYRQKHDGQVVKTVK